MLRCRGRAGHGSTYGWPREPRQLIVHASVQCHADEQQCRARFPVTALSTGQIVCLIPIANTMASPSATASLSQMIVKRVVSASSRPARVRLSRYFN